MSRNRSNHWWPAALTLAERAAERSSARPDDGAPGGAGDVVAATDSSAARRLDRWRRQRPFERPDLLARRLRVDGLTESEFVTLLGEKPENLGARTRVAPSWATAIEHSVADTDAHAWPRVELMASPTQGGLEPARAFVQPLAAAALSRLFDRARSIRAGKPGAPFEPARATRLFEPALWSQLIGRAVKVVILELNVARVRGTLTGETPEARCADFVRQLYSTDLRRRILEEYPVLARALAMTTENWERFAAEFLDHLAADSKQIVDLFAPETGLGTLDALTLGAGDSHRHGRSVIVAAFSSGTRLVYKPRPLSVDRHFEELLDWINTRGQTPPLRTARTLCVRDHGWAEFAANTPCASPEEVNRFYERFGAYLALLHALEATDFHYENVIASGEHPVLIDLEALFHPRTALLVQRDDPEWLGWAALHYSVLRAGVLPFRAFATDESRGVDMSAVGGGAGQWSPNRVPVVAAAGTDEMHLVRDFVRLPDSRNRPALGGQPVDPARYTDRILAGFSTTYRLLVRHRAELLAPGGPIHQFADDAIRVVLRPTRQYALIIGESYHPDVLRCALERDRLLDRLWVAVPARSELERVIRSEHADLVGGDVPLFTSRPRSRDLITTHGASIPDFFEQPGLDAAVERIESLCEEDLLRQQWVIRASLAGLAPGRHENPSTLPVQPSRETHVAPPSSDECIEAARLVARRISALALRKNDRVSWLGLTLARERDWIVQPIGSDMYEGTAGIALFLAYLADIVGDAEHEDLARAIVGQVVRRARVMLDAPDASSALAPGALGAFGTLGGAVYTLSHIGALWSDPTLIDVAETLVAHASDSIAADRVLDVIGGVAGFIGALAALDRARGSSQAHIAMRACADRLLACAEPAGNGIGWTTALPSWQPLTGLSHGASGIALGFLTSGRILGDEQLIDAAVAALRYERSTFDPACGNWPDYRILDDGPRPASPTMMWSWCHGAPGIGLARLAALSHVREPELVEDLDAAVRSTDRVGFGSNDSLCHGDLGNLELFLRARELGYDGGEQRLSAESARLVRRIGSGQWGCGIPGAVETPGLMMGLAGIGYGLLRLGATRRVPSLLSLEAPRRTLVARVVP